MMDPLEKDVRSGERMQQILDDPLWQECLEKLKHRAYEDFKRATTNEQRLAAQNWSKICEEFPARMKALAENGKVAAQKIETRKRKEI